MQETRHYLAGGWRDSDRHRDNINPSDTRDCLGAFAQADAALLDEAVAAAVAAQPVWAAMPLEQRQAALQAIGDRLQADADALATLLAREEGKPFAEARGEVFRAGQFFQYYAAECLRLIGENADSVRPGVEIDVRREPIGVVGVISPWNFPLATASWKIAPALAYGNSVVWKPASLTPASALALAQIVDAVGLPPGVFNVLLGSGSELGDAMATHPDIAAISFTGSVAVGQALAARAITTMKRIQLEMGSKNPLVVLDDADLDLAVAHAVQSAFGGTGQKCTAASRLIVHTRVHDAFVERLVAATEALQVGHALAPDTRIGPVVSAEQLDANLAAIATGIAEGAQLCCGGERLTRDTPGYYMAPAVFSETDNAMTINRNELFAPITCVLRADDYAHALAIANDTPFGLVAGIMTRSLAHATHFRRHARAGCISVNLPTAGTDYHVPFGGRGISSYGPREQGKHAREFYTVTKTAYIAAGEV